MHDLRVHKNARHGWMVKQNDASQSYFRMPKCGCGPTKSQVCSTESVPTFALYPDLHRRYFLTFTIVDYSTLGASTMASASTEAPPVLLDSAMSGVEPSAPATKPEDAPHYTHVSNTDDREPPKTFTSSLSFTLDGNGTTPINDTPENPDIVVSTSVTTASETPGKRMARKSKIDALAALNRSSSPSAETSKTGIVKSERDKLPAPILNGTSTSVLSGLDMSSVKTMAPRKIPPRKEPRPFGLEDCPTFYPSPEEFKDALSYINTIAPKAQEYGIAKVVPPVGWKMPFVTDTEVSQRLHTIY